MNPFTSATLPAEHRHRARTLTAVVALLLAAPQVLALPGDAGTLSLSFGPAAPIVPGDVVTVTLRITNYSLPRPVDGVSVTVELDSELFSFIPGSFVANDAPMPDENWLRKPAQDEVGPGPILRNNTFLAGNCVMVVLSDNRFTPGGTLASAGFLLSFQLQALRPGEAHFRLSNPILWDPSGLVAGSPGVTDLTVPVSNPNIPRITAQPVDVTVPPGAIASFNVAATGPDLQYQWQRNGVPLLDAPRVVGARTPTLTLLNVQAGEDAVFDCVVANFVGEARTLAARLAVCNSPVIATNAISQVVPLLSTVGFSVLAGGTPAPAIQWYRNDVPIPGEISSLLLLTNVHRAMVGLYYAVAENACGRATSAVAELQIRVTLIGPIERGVEATDQFLAGGGGGGGGGRLASAIPVLPFHGVPLLYSTYGATGVVACGSVTGYHCKYVQYSHTRSNQMVTATAHASEFPTMLVVTDRTPSRTVLACAIANGPDRRSSTVEFPAASPSIYNVWAGGLGTNTGNVRIQIGDAFQNEQFKNGAFTFEVAGDVSSRDVGFTYTVMTTGRVDAAITSWPQVVTVFPLTNDWVFAFTNPTPRADLIRVYGLRGVINTPPVLGIVPFGRCLTNKVASQPRCGCSSPFLPR